MKKGFTLIELMIVIAIIILLVAIAIPNYTKMQDRARISAVSSDLKSIATAIEAFYADWGKYPGQGGTASYTNLKAELTGGTGATINTTGKTTLSGDTAPVVYITTDAFTALENKVGGSSVPSYSLAGNTYTLSVTIPVGGTNKTISVTNGGQIKIN
ncbi:MAG: prepilin-type N-terminal cleavage/methylation domain-containing protein [Nitrososphaeria archaeon]